mmetsp:Transcript_31407/g.5679  ORF Transcript_31407/g.5679 Transcript_31407/m.5679 type:complete len:139 (+) Transcript_31407:648-1064(+)
MENKDYILIPQTAYKILSSQYGNDNNEIKRFTVQDGQGKYRVEARLRELKITPIPPLSDGPYETRKVLVSDNDQLSSIKEKITRILQREVGKTKYNLSKSKLWKLKPNKKLNDIVGKLGKKKETFDEIEEIKDNQKLS